MLKVKYTELFKLEVNRMKGYANNTYGEIRVLMWPTTKRHMPRKSIKGSQLV